jgi:hypothetical protein
VSSTRRRRRRPSTTPDTPASTKPGWRQTIDSFGGFTVVVPIALALVVIGTLVLRTPLGFSSSDDPLLGEAVSLDRTLHVDVGTLGPNPPLTPAGGPHYVNPLRRGIYDRQMVDGNAIHALEHGLVWITYQPDAVSEADLEILNNVASDFSRDVILSPRAENSVAIIIVSWGQRLTMDEPDEQVLRDFVTTNRNRSPEPGIREQ